MIVYKYFLGCANYQEVKARYRELAKLWHPDTVTGDKATFQELVDEYSMLGEGDYYPIKNIQKANYNFSYGVVYSESIQEQTTNLNQEEIEKEKAINYFNNLRVNDITFSYIDEVINFASKEKLNKLWIYQEIQKKWDLTLDHFKYVTFKMKDKVHVAKELYRKYQLNMV